MVKNYIKIEELLYSGIHLAKKEYEVLAIKTINSASLCLIIMSIFVSFANFFLHTYFNSLLYLVCTALFFFNFYLINHNKIIFVKYIVVYTILFIPIINFLVNGRIPDFQYLGIIPLTALSLFFSYIIFTERIHFCTSLVIIFLYSAFFDYFLSDNPPQIIFLANHYYAYKIFHLLTLFILCIILNSVKNILLEYQKKIHYQQLLLEKVNLSLEERVEKKTASILNSKKRIEDLAHLTSHNIRGPLASILGYTQILINEPNDIKLHEALPLLHEKAKEMDLVIRNMNQKIEEETIETKNIQ